MGVRTECRVRSGAGVPPPPPSFAEFKCFVLKNARNITAGLASWVTVQLACVSSFFLFDGESSKQQKSMQQQRFVFSARGKDFFA